MVRCPLPINLSGDNLGQRHRQLNTLVTEAHKAGVRFKKIRDRQEVTPVDRLFKIDLAAKMKNVDYILQNFQDEDMLYVSRALKAKWLLEQKYQDIINPKNLEENLYPYMFTTAVSKLKNWLYLHLKDSERCEDFYQYYSEYNFEYAIKFLGHCNNDFILSETSKVSENLSPHNFKILCEKCPQMAKVYFDSMPNNDKLRIKFLDNEEEFYNSLKVVLKLDADIFFDITEKYFSHKYNRSLTKYIMANHKDRFDKKPELYAGMLLNMQALAECLSSEECKELVLKLSRATYICNNVDYKFVEPLIKRMPVSERAAFKKRVFVEKDIGDVVKAWPYEAPSLPKKDPYEGHVFRDSEKANLLDFRTDGTFGGKLKRTKYARVLPKMCLPAVQYCPCQRTYLDKLFDQYRFFSFERTLFELRQRIKEDSLPQNRQYMLLVLVSKSGGLPAHVASLLQLLEQHSNEPVNVRAAVVTSLVKRAAVWRLPQHSWEAMLEFSRGLGLDGSTSDADCREGLHAVVIRSLLETGNCVLSIRDAYIQDFSRLDEYSTDNNERQVIKETMPQVILAAVDAESSPVRQAELLTSLLEFLQTYKVDVESSRLIPAVAALHKRDASAAEDVLLRLFRAKIARRTLFREIFPLIQTDASYLNALRHDTSVLNVSTFVDLIQKGEFRPEQFLRKLAIYFAESSGMMHGYLDEIKGRITTNLFIGKSIARPFCLLHESCLDYVQSLDVTNKDVARLAAAIQANMHVSRPKLYLDKKLFATIAPKAIANKVMICPTVEVKKYVDWMLTKKRTIRMAVLLTERIGNVADTYYDAANLRSTATLKPAIRYIRRQNDDFDISVWRFIQQLSHNINLYAEEREYLRAFMCRVENIPLTIKADYCMVVYSQLKLSNYYHAMRVLSEVEFMLPDISEDFVENLLLDLLNEFESNKRHERNRMCISLYLRVLVKFLLICKSQAVQKKRWKTQGEPFLLILEMCREKFKKEFMGMFEEVLSILQYNNAFFDSNIVSPLPVFENIITWMRQYLPLELHFRLYLRIHLTMLYLKSIRLSIESHPNIFNNEKRKLSEGVTLVGFVFGGKIAQELNKLMERYFTSAVELYRTGLEDYFRNYFKHDSSKYLFMKAVIQGVLRGSTGEEIRIALYLFQSEYKYYDQEDRKEILAEMKNITDEKFKYFLYSELSHLHAKM